MDPRGSVPYGVRPRQQNRPEGEGADRIAGEPVCPECPIVPESAAAEYRHERAAERHEGGAGERGQADIGAGFAQAAEPWRTAERPADGDRIKDRNRAVGRERHQHLRERHPDTGLGDHMGKECRRDIEPPALPRREEQGSEEDDVGRPEGREDPVRQGTDREGGFRSDVISDRHQDRPDKRPSDRQKNAHHQRLREGVQSGRCHPCRPSARVARLISVVLSSRAFLRKFPGDEPVCISVPARLLKIITLLRESPSRSKGMSYLCPISG